MTLLGKLVSISLRLAIWATHLGPSVIFPDQKRFIEPFYIYLFSLVNYLLCDAHSIDGQKELGV